VKEILKKIFEDNTLSESEIREILLEITKRDSFEDLSEIALYMKKNAKPLKLKSPTGLIDICGTGGDCLGTFNISTAVSFVIAGAGAKVVKHGNRSVSSKCGSADVLEALGVSIEIPEEKLHQKLHQRLQIILDDAGMVFLFAPHYHPSMAKIKEIRKALGVPTIFNLLGPLVNPVNLDYQIIGVYDQNKCEIIAKALLNLGIKEAMVVYGESESGGLDEFSTTGKTLIYHIKNGKIKKIYLSPEEVGLKRAEIKDLLGGDAKENAQIILKILQGEKGPKRDIVLLNSAAALVVSGIAKDFKDGIKKAEESIDSGAALKVLEKLKSCNHIAFLDKIKELKEKQLIVDKSPKREALKMFLENDFSIIAEIKKASPSKGNIRLDANIVAIAGEYINNGAAVISVLTETDYFKGNIEYLKEIRQKYPNSILLRKDFIIDPYQIYEAKICGADMILLILALTGVEKTKELIRVAKELGLETLVEVHTEEEMTQALELDTNFIGVNNRNLQTLEFSLDVSRDLAKYINNKQIFVCESGLKTSEEIIEMINLGYKGFLIGSHFMELDSPGEELKKLIEEVNHNG